MTNTSATQTIAAKIRFREQERSMDVLDFIVVLSPNDKFDFSVRRSQGDRRPTMSWIDNSCVVGPGASGPGSVQFPAPSPFVDGRSASMSTGHLEVLGMADLTNVCVNSAGPAVACPMPRRYQPRRRRPSTLAPDQMPPNCGILVTTLSQAPRTWRALNAAHDASGSRRLCTTCGNVLVGRYVITACRSRHRGRQRRHRYPGLRPRPSTPALRPYHRSPPRAVPPAIEETVSRFLQQYAWARRRVGSSPSRARSLTSTGFQTALQSANITGDWSNNPANSVGVDWVLSFPDKYAYLDLVPADQCAGGVNTGEEWCLLYQHPVSRVSADPAVWTGHYPGR